MSKEPLADFLNKLGLHEAATDVGLPPPEMLLLSLISELNLRAGKDDRDIALISSLVTIHDAVKKGYIPEVSDVLRCLFDQKQ